MRKLIAFLCLFSACAYAKPKPAPFPPPKPALSDDVDYADAEEALAARKALQTWLAEGQIIELRWQRARAKLIEKYGVDPDKDHGWDIQPDGKLKARRAPPPPKK